MEAAVGGVSQAIWKPPPPPPVISCRDGSTGCDRPIVAGAGRLAAPAAGSAARAAIECDLARINEGTSVDPRDCVADGESPTLEGRVVHPSRGALAIQSQQRRAPLEGGWACLAKTMRPRGG